MSHSQDQTPQRAYNSRNPFARAAQDYAASDAPPSYNATQYRDARSQYSSQTDTYHHRDNQYTPPTTAPLQGYYQPPAQEYCPPPQQSPYQTQDPRSYQYPSQQISCSYAGQGDAYLTQDRQYRDSHPSGQGLYGRDFSGERYGDPHISAQDPHAAQPYPPSPSNISSSPYALPSTQPAAAGAGPSSSAGMGEKAMHFATGDSVAKLLDPPPLSFARAPAPGLAYAPFPPAVLEGRGADLGAGFPALTPRCAAPPHPFATHDVREDDWARFVHDVGTAGKLSGTERVVSNVLPTALSMGFVAGMFVTKGIEKHMRGRRAGAVGKLLDAWNQNFFGPRRMYVVLAQGRTAFNGDLNALPPDIAAYGGSQNDNDDSDSDSSSDSSNGSGRDRSRRSREKHEHERRKQRRQEIHDRRQHRREERQKRRSEKHEDKEKFRLVVAYKPY